MNNAEWKPIEEAKKDGTPYIINNPRWEYPKFGRWDKGHENPIYVTHGGYWCTLGRYEINGNPAPTHFMEMPPRLVVNS